jgi:superfamily II DNA/RNA helicase
LSQPTETAQDALTEDQASVPAPTVTFADLGLSPKVEAAITDAGYTIPTPIQAGAIPHALQGKDVLGIAQTGTGKTAAFVLPMITRLEKGQGRARYRPRPAPARPPPLCFP